MSSVPKRGFQPRRWLGDNLGLDCDVTVRTLVDGKYVDLDIEEALRRINEFDEAEGARALARLPFHFNMSEVAK
ncbi:hypothetical protein F2P45_06280 [Massilia sp. CCM 8733]|uniref:Uncharacterized protein n=1 Tax=Massilia mucilaginosa TaxID=2609282 RepID=A0ABX0NPA6_9BURK|nr:hypothetical protein [Massilia mucilaginosa]NHZ88631.1 hypothetical protein [Massilia mucilaginosa]